MTHPMVQNSITREWAKPRYGIGYGGQGTWMNKHFATIEEAQAEFDSQVAQLHTIYGTSATISNELPAMCSSRLVQTFSIVNTKKNGKPGKMRQTVTLYQITE